MENFKKNEDRIQSHGEFQQQSHIKHAHRFIAAYFILIILIIVVAGIYSWQHKKVHALNTKVASLNSQLVSLQKQVTSLRSTKIAANSMATTSPAYLNQNPILITALGIKLEVPDAIKAMVIGNPTTSVSGGSEVTSVKLSTQTIATSILDCSNDGLGTLTKTIGTYPKLGVTNSTWHEQFSGFYLSLNANTNACAPSTTPQTDQDLLIAQLAVFNAALPSAQLIN
jgi:outer membrane murein-binding lipoprotein Lpp